jgi:ATP-dependent RNA helicase SUPV3L1/SUV3
LLAPLFSLTAADDITGVARGVAFQLVESLGVLERQKVAEEVKGLDQPARATLRKYGVRFGAYHIYLPALLKPAPRSLATQLWAIKHESPEAKGVGDLLHLAASGRTSIPVDKDTPKALYRTAGYRICGERAVRVDILERLADLIRPALSWRESAPGPKPDGVFDGRGFLVTGAMTSLTGASGDDFASILRSLGYRMDRRPKPAEPTAAAPVAEPAAVSNDVPATVEATTEAIGEATAEAGSSSEKPEPVAELQSRSLLPEPELVASETAPETVPGADASALVAEPATESAAPTDTPPVAVAENKPAEEPAFVEVWRPAGRSERRPHRPRRPRPQQTQTASSDAAAVPATTSADGTAPATSDSAQPSQGPRARAMIVANVPTGRSGRSGMNASNGWSARVSARSGKVTPPAATDRGANAASVSIGPNVNSTTQSLSAAAPEGATSSRIRIPRSPSLPRSNSSLNRPTKSRLENERQGIGTPADRQMVVACADGTDADRCRRNYDGGICPPQRKTHDGRRPSGASWRCGYGCA